MYSLVSPACRKLTVTDGLERCLKKGRGEEQALAAHCIALLFIQLGVGDDSDELFKALRPTLLVHLADNAVACRARGAVCLHFSFSCLYTCIDMHSMPKQMGVSR